MFHPIEQPMERGWVGRVDGGHVVQLAAQTLESFFTGGGSAREHAVYPLEGVRLLAPVLHPWSIRVFDEQSSFAFANPAAVVGPEAEIANGPLALLPRLAAVIGLEGALAGYTVFGEWRRSGAPVPKDRDFALALGPVVVTPDALAAQLSVRVRVDGEQRLDTGLGSFDWTAARDLAAQGTRLRPGDLLAGPAPGRADSVPAGASVEIEVNSIGTLRQHVR
jgi:hypothetical protein